MSVVEMAATMASMATPVVAGLGGSVLSARRTASKVQLRSGTGRAAPGACVEGVWDADLGAFLLCRFASVTQPMRGVLEDVGGFPILLDSF